MAILILPAGYLFSFGAHPQMMNFRVSLPKADFQHLGSLNARLNECWKTRAPRLLVSVLQASGFGFRICTRFARTRISILTLTKTSPMLCGVRPSCSSEQWSQWDSILTLPHQIYISPYDPERHVWVIDSGGGEGHHQVLKFTNDGSELVMQLGEKNHPTTRDQARSNPNPGPYTYGWPSKLAFFPDGSFLLADGYWNSRVIKYTEEGEFVSEFGSLGDGPGEFDLLHGLAVDRNRRIYVGDRTNNRIQVFTEDGEFIQEWPDIYDPVNIYIDVNDWVWVISARLNRILKYNTDGELQYHWGTYGETVWLCLWVSNSF